MEGIKNRSGEVSRWGTNTSSMHLHKEAGMEFSHFLALQMFERELFLVLEKAREKAEACGISCGDLSLPNKSQPNPVAAPPAPKQVADNSSDTDTDSDSDSDTNSDTNTNITAPDSSSDEESDNETTPGKKGKLETEGKADLNFLKSQKDAKQQFKEEQEQIKNEARNDLEKALSENAKDEDRQKALGNLNQIFGNQNCQTEQEQAKMVAKELFKNNPALYRVTMVGEVEKVFINQAIAESELKLTEELKKQ